MRRSSVRGERAARCLGLLSAAAAVGALLRQVGDSITLSSIEHGVGGQWLVPVALCVGPLVSSARDVARAGFALGLCVPTFLWTLEWGENPVFQVAVGAAVLCLAGVALAAIRAADEGRAVLHLTASATSGALLVASIALCWWWPTRWGATGPHGQLMVSPFHVLAATFFSIASRHLLRHDARGGIWLALGHVAFTAAPHHGELMSGCLHFGGPARIASSWPALVLGPWWSYVLQRPRVVAAATGGSVS